MQGVDYSTARPNLQALRDAGISFVCRYLAYLPNDKVLLDAERKQIHAAGLGIILNWEQAAGDMAKGFATGVSHAREALRQADALGAPADVPIYFSCDIDTTSANIGGVDQYIDGVLTILPYARIGVYGEADVIDRYVGTKVKWGWQTYAWSGGRTSTKAHIKQYKNNATIGGQSDVDLDQALSLTIGMWTGDEMTVADEKASNADAYLWHTTQLDDTVPGIQGGGKTFEMPNPLVALLKRLDSGVSALVSRPATVSLSDADLQRFAAELAAESVPDAVAAKVRELLASAKITWDSPSA